MVSAEQREAAVQKQLQEQAAKDAERAKTEAQIAESESRFRSAGEKHYLIELNENLGIGDGSSSSSAHVVNLVENLGATSSKSDYANTQAIISRRLAAEKASLADLQARESQIQAQIQ